MASRQAPRPARRLPVTWLAILAGILLPAAGLASHLPAGGRFLFSATLGGGAASPRVLLRWVATERPSPYSRYLIRKRAAAEAGFANLAFVERLADAPAIEAVFPAPGDLRDEVTALIVPDLGPTLGEALLALRQDSDPAGGMQYRMLINTNYAVAIVEGVAYLDTAVVGGTLYEYELWGVDAASGQAVERLGKVWARAGVDTSLPKPAALEAVRIADVDFPPSGDFPGPCPVLPPPCPVPPCPCDIDVDGDGKFDGGEFGDGKIYLKWNPSPNPAKDRETQPTGFGFDIFRRAKDPDPSCPAAPDLATAVKVNEWPVVPLPATDSKVPDFFFVDDNSNASIPPIVKGTAYCYWLVARDLLRQRGQFSDVKEACPPDLSRPRQVRDVKTQVLVPPTGGIRISWRANSSDPVTLEGGTPYVDDTARYNVYRMTDISKDLKAPSPALLVAGCSNLSAATTSCTDPLPADHRGTIYWYAVTATDTAVCGNPPNESPYSSPARGVVYDDTAPVITNVLPFCRPRTTCPPPSGTGHELPCIRCFACDPSHSPCPPAEADDDPWCDAGGSVGIFPRPCDDWGYEVHAVAPTPMDPDTMSVRLYRAAGKSDFRPVEEAFLSGPGDTVWDAHEEFRTRMAQKLDYRLRALDRDSNVGPVANPAVPAYLQGTEPPPRPTIVRALVEADGDLQIRWHAPAAEALVGFILRVGAPGDRFDNLDLEILPDNNALLSEATAIPPPGVPFVDVDFDGRPSPYRIIVTNATRNLGVKGNDLGPFLTRTSGYFERTVPGLALQEDSVVEVFSIDVAGQLSEPGTSKPTTSTFIAIDNLDWPGRPAPLTFDLAAAPEEGDPTPDYVELCWDRNQRPPGGKPFGHPPLIAVFRALVDPGRPDSYQQRSPRLDIARYDAGAGNELDCSSCADELQAALGGAPGSLVCWRDYGVQAGKSYRYTVIGFAGPPDEVNNPAKRDEGEILAVYGSPAANVTVAP